MDFSMAVAHGIVLWIRKVSMQTVIFPVRKVLIRTVTVPTGIILYSVIHRTQIPMQTGGVTMRMRDLTIKAPTNYMNIYCL